MLKNTLFSDKKPNARIKASKQRNIQKAVDLVMRLRIVGLAFVSGFDI